MIINFYWYVWKLLFYDKKIQKAGKFWVYSARWLLLKNKQTNKLIFSISPAFSLFIIVAENFKYACMFD